MKIIEYMKRLSQSEKGECIDGLTGAISEDYYDIDDEIDDDLFGKSIWGKRTKKEDEIYNKWSNMLGGLSLDLTPFRDANFLKTFLRDIPEEEQFKFVYNTTVYCYGKEEYDSRYVILTRRALPSMEDKPEQFWTSEHLVAMNGLRREIPLGSPHRLHSVILATTLETLERYGFAFNASGVSDGEVMINYIPFKRDDILFVHKSDEELSLLSSYLKNGGLHLQEVLEEIKKTAEARQKHYNGTENEEGNNRVR